jgi:hypothetical protein
MKSTGVSRSAQKTWECWVFKPPQLWTPDEGKALALRRPHKLTELWLFDEGRCLPKSCRTVRCVREWDIGSEEHDGSIR